MKKAIILLLLCVTTVLSAVSITRNRVSNQEQISFTLENYRINNKDEYSRILFDSASYIVDENGPQIPLYIQQFSVPEGFVANLHYSVIESETITLEKALIPFPQVVRGNQVDEYIYEIDSSKYENNYDLVQFGEKQSFRNLSYADLIIRPFKYDYASNTLEVFKKINIYFSLEKSNTKSSVFDRLERDFASAFVNKENLFTINPKRYEVEYANFDIANHWYKIEVDKDGIFSIGYNQLNSLMTLSDIDPHNFRMFTAKGNKLKGRNLDTGNPFAEIPLLVTGEDDSNFDTSDKIIFYARDRNDYDYTSNISSQIKNNPFSDNGVYWLTYDANINDQPRRIMQENNSEIATISRTNNPNASHYERDFYKRLQTNYFWFSNYLAGSSTSNYNFDLDIEDLDPVSNGNYNYFRISMIEEKRSSGTSSRHYASISLNDEVVVDSKSWTGSTYVIVEEDELTFNEGNNEVTVTIERTGKDNIYLDWIQLYYLKKNLKRSGKQYGVNYFIEDINTPVKYDFTGSFSNNTLVFATPDLYDVSLLDFESSNNSLSFVGKVFVDEDENDNEDLIEQFYITDNDYYSIASIEEFYGNDILVNSLDKTNLIITPDDFYPQAERLASLYASLYGQSTYIAKAEDIYNTFNGGMVDPTAIRNYIRYVYNESSERPEYVILLGSGTYDWRNNKSGSAVKNKMIVYLNPSSTNSDNTNSDDFFVYINQINKPDLAIARYPAKNTNELDLMIDKFEEYSNKEFDFGWWRNRALFLTDDLENGTTLWEDYHVEDMEMNITNLPSGVILNKLHAHLYEPDELGKKPNVREDLITEINRGNIYTYYAGHGSYDQLGTEAFFRRDIDTERLTNDKRRTVLITAACDVSQFDSPEFDCLSTDVMLSEDGGAINSIGSTRLCVSPSNNSLAGDIVYEALENRNDVGTALMFAKARNTSSSFNNEKFVLFGDPHVQAVPPARTTNASLVDHDPSYQAKETVFMQGSINNFNLDEAMVIAFDSAQLDSLVTPYDTVYVAKQGNKIFDGKTSVNAGNYDLAFVVPEDIIDGPKGKVLVYGYDEATKEEHLDYYYPLELAGHDFFVDNQSAPNIDIWLESYDFREGDTVSQNPLLIANIEDENGINVLGSTGHKLSLIIDDDFNPIDITEYFAFDIDSYQKGKVEYQITDLSVGDHVLKILAFDNLNRPSVKSINFKVTESSSLALTNILPYPNPMPKNGGYFTFIINNDANVAIDIYTITGKKIQSISQYVTKGFNKILWNGRDKHGDKLANNTYFYIIKASTEEKTITHREKFIIMDK